MVLKIEASSRVCEALFASWPEHRRFIETCFAERDQALLGFGERVAQAITAIAGDHLSELVTGYRAMCDMVLNEEMHFRRTGLYRHSDFATVLAEVYSDPVFMTKYMNGLLLSQLLWTNHTRTLQFYCDRFLATTQKGGKHLEIGPGHGLLLYFAQASGLADLSAWDVSNTSLKHTRECLGRMGATKNVALECRNIYDPTPRQEKFDSIVLSEVLEHLEQPKQALSILRDLLTDEGRAYINVPVNSPAVDHIFLLRSPEEALQLIEEAGLVVEHHLFAPSSGHTEELARRRKTAISVAVIARRRP